MRKRRGFTIAEVLITLGIIGIVAAMTMPALLAKYHKHAYVVGLKKAYSQLNQMAQFAISQEGCSSNDLICAIEANGSSEEARIGSLIKRYMKVALDCTGNNLTNTPECANPSWDDEVVYNANNVGYLVLADGTMLLDNYEFLMVDVNGKKKPNKFGLDQFMFELQYNDGNHWDASQKPSIKIDPTQPGKHNYTGLFVPFGHSLFNGEDYDDSCKGDVDKMWENEQASFLFYCATRKVLFENAINYY